jgi:PAS domain S-box-containing protein
MTWPSTPLLDPLRQLVSPETLDAVIVDEAVAARKRQERARRLNVVEIPLLRAIGFGLLAFAVLVHNELILDGFVFAPWARFSGGAAVYALLSWLALRTWHGRTGPVDLGVVFLVTDIAVFLGAIYVSGGDQSWIFLLLIFRVVDQVTAGVRRALFFAHYVTAAYIGLLLFLAGYEGRAIAWTTEYGKIGCLYAGGLYIAFTARGPEFRRRRAAEAIRIARSLIRELGQQSGELLTSKSRTEDALTRQVALAKENARLYDVSQQQQQRLTQIFNSTSDGILFVNQQGRLEAANRRAGELLGFAPASVTGEPIAAILRNDGRHGDLADTLERHSDHPERAAQGYVDVVEPRRTLYWAAQPLGPPGRGAGFTVTIFDVTQSRDLIRELKRKSQLLEESTRRAESASAAKSAFVANMSHEIRTPLTSILGLTQLALDGEPTVEQHERLATVMASAESLLAILNDVLDFARIEADQLPLRPASFSLRDTLDDVLHTFGFAAQAKGLELRGHVTPAVPDALIGDAGRLRQILVNLVANAVKFTDAGEVAVRVTLDGQTPGSVTVHVAVSDTGNGVPAGKQHQIFEPFVQADASSTRRHAGSGLGLSICSQLVGLMGGELWLEDQAEPGSTFHFTATFPVQREAADPNASFAASLGSLRGAAVLVAVANPGSRELVASLLTAWGMHPESVDDGTSALRALEAAASHGRPFRIALLDHALTGTPAADLCDTLARSSVPEPRIVLLKPMVTPDCAPLRHPRVTAYCPTPVTRRRLLDAMLLAGGLHVAGPREANPKPPGTPDRPCRVLIAEDTKTNRLLVEHLLRDRGHRVSGAATGQEAIHAVSRDAFDVILMDLQMPDMDGFECAERIRDILRGSATPIRIVAMTAAAMPGDPQRCLDAGMDDYLAKPIDRDALYSAVEAIVGQDRETSFQPAAFVARLGGDVELAQRLSRVFLSEAPDLLAQVQSALERRDADAVAASAHALKGMLGNFGASDAYATAARLEATAVDGDLTSAAELCRTLETALDRLTPALHPLIVDARDTSSYPRH